MKPTIIVGKFKWGDIVYPAFSPVQVGKIIALGDIPVGPRGYLFELLQPVTIRKLNGKLLETTAGCLKNFEQLVLDHERKAKKFRDQFEQLKQS